MSQASAQSESAIRENSVGAAISGNQSGSGLSIFAMIGLLVLAYLFAKHKKLI